MEDQMDINNEVISLRVLIGAVLQEIDKIWGKSTLNAMIHRLGTKAADPISEIILKKYSHSIENPFDNPSSAMSFFENTITKLYKMEILERRELSDRYEFKIKNICALRNIIKSRDEFNYNGTLCEFTFGYFETTLKKLTGLEVEYRYNALELNNEYCYVNLIFFKPKKNKKEEEINKDIIEDQQETEEK